MDDWKEPQPAVLVALASLVVHLEEIFDDGHGLDVMAIKGVMAMPGLSEWVESVPEVLLPAKRR